MAYSFQYPSPKRRKTSSSSSSLAFSNCWSDINEYLLGLILRKVSFSDIPRITAVCRSWNSIAKTHNPYLSLKIQPPYLMLDRVRIDFGEIKESPPYVTSFYSMATRKFHEIEDRGGGLQLGKSSRCIGSSRGWLILLDETHEELHIFSPFLDMGIPPIYLPTRAVPMAKKAILWGDLIRDPNNYAIVVIHDLWSRIVFAKCGDHNWSSLTGSGPWSSLEGSGSSYSDIICSQNLVFSLTWTGQVEAWDFSCTDPVKVLEIKPSFDKCVNSHGDTLESDLYTHKFYLVESLDELFLVKRYVAEYVGPDEEVVCEDDFVDGYIYPYKTKFFRVYRLDFTEEKWFEVDSLGDWVLFLGGSESTAFSTREFPEYKKDSIFFTDDYKGRIDEHYSYGGHDMGVFKLEDGCIKYIEGDSLHRIQPPPFWVVPYSI